VTADPSDLACRYTRHERERRDIARHYGARPDKRVFSNRHATNDRGIRADGRATAHQGSPILVLADNGRARVVNVREHHARPAENIVFKRDRIVDGYVVLDLDVITDEDIVPNENVLA